MTNDAINFDLGSLVIHLGGAAVGALIAVGLGYDKTKDGQPTTRTTALAVCLFTASLFTGLVVLLNGMLQNETLGLGRLLSGYDIVWNVLAWTFMLFFVPMLCLGTISPQVIRLSIPDTAHAGRTAGTIYAWSTAGAIVGTFAAGYLLIDWLGMARVLFFLAIVLMATDLRDRPALEAHALALRREHHLRRGGRRHVRCRLHREQVRHGNQVLRDQGGHQGHASRRRANRGQDPISRPPDSLVRAAGRPDLARLRARGSAGGDGPVSPGPRGAPRSWSSAAAATPSRAGSSTGSPKSASMSSRSTPA